MAQRMRDLLLGSLGELRHEPIAQRLRASVDGVPVLDSSRAQLVWEPRRVVPSYAVPAEDVLVPVVEPDRPPPTGDGAGTPPVLHPGIPFAVHSTDGVAVDLRPPGAARSLAGFRPADPDLADHLVLDFAGAEWLEEEDTVFGHPRDPFHRIDVRAASRPVRVELDGTLLAESDRAVLLFETSLPMRTYLPAEDVAVPLLPSGTRTWCAYKGEASYRSADVDGQVVRDLVWCYEEPRPEVGRIRGLVAFYDERVDVVVGGARRERPVTPFA